jgi:uncharacterized protein
MLTADLVRVRKSAGRLSVTSVQGKTKTRIEPLCVIYLQTARDMGGQTYGQLREAFDAVDVSPRDKKLAAGLQKLVEDGCTFEAHADLDPRQLRSEVFLRAAEARRELGASFERLDVLSAVAKRLEIESNAVDAALFSDLRSEHLLVRAPAFTAADLLAAYDAAQYQAVLLRAVHVTATVRCSAPAQYRALFRALKFRRLLHVIHPHEGGYRIEIDGPFSLFESVTKYGLQLALMFPILSQCDALQLVAKVRWGKAREALLFEYSRTGGVADAQATLPPDVEALVVAFDKLGTDWSVRVNEELLELPGVGVCIPDLVFSRGGCSVYLEVMGFWSRDAVWKRVELVQAGLPHKILFAVSTRLRVSEAVLEEEEGAGLYVYKGAMSPRALLARIELVAGERTGKTRR